VPHLSLAVSRIQGSVTLPVLEVLPLWGVKINRILARKGNQLLPAPWKK
jgi:hypothetical protein